MECRKKLENLIVRKIYQRIKTWGVDFFFYQRKFFILYPTLFADKFREIEMFLKMEEGGKKN